MILPLEGLIDHEAERAKMRKALADFERQIGSLRSKLANESFVARAPAEVVTQIARQARRARVAAGRGGALLQEA